MGVVIYTDGGARGNPGPAGIGVVIEENGVMIAEFGKYIGDKITNNWAEYEALVLALMEAEKLGLTKKTIEIRMDSELIVRQMQGVYKVKDKDLKVQYARVRELLSDFTAVEFVHIPREKNKEADRLVNEAIDSVKL